tara:strand:- start:778 stop:1983 length:1206 start_codon:yes stop_codon:yes gene_type:complete
MKIAFLTSGGNAPCLSAAIGRLLYNYNHLDGNVEIIAYTNGFSGLLRGDSIEISLSDLNDDSFNIYYEYGGSPIGNSRVKLTNKDDCVNKKLIKNNQDPLDVAATQLIKDKIDILHPIGGDDTNTTARDLSNFINSKGLDITIVGIPKTIDNDIFPVKRSLGADTAADAGSIYFENIVNENNMSDFHLIIHEIMGRNSGWLAARTADLYYKRLDSKENQLINSKAMSFYNSRRLDIHALYIPEKKIDFNIEIPRLEKIIKNVGCLNIFVSEGAFLKEISSELEAKDNTIDRDAFGHIKLDSIDTGRWLSKFLSKRMRVDKTLIQKSGYFSRSSAPNKHDLNYIFRICDFGFKEAIKGRSGLAAEDQRTNQLSCIDFNEIKGNKDLDTKSDWFRVLNNRIFR